MNKNKRNDIIVSSSIMIVIALMFVAMAFLALPEILGEKTEIDSDPIKILPEWKELSEHPNRLPTYVWFVKVSESRERVEHTTSFDDFSKKFDNGELIRVEYVIEHYRVVIYGDEEISLANTKLWKTVVVPEQTLNGSVSFSRPETREDGIVYKEFSNSIASMKIFVGAITVFLFVMIFFMFDKTKKIYDEDYEKEDDKKETDEETRS